MKLGFSKPAIVAALLAGSAYSMLALGSPAGAAPLDDAACERLKLEQAALLLSGARENMAQGPDWAKANLTASKLKDIARLIEVDEQLLFRCPQPKPAVEAANGKTEDDDAPGTKAKEAAAPKAKANEKTSARPAAAVPAPVRKPVPPPKKKPNDAYVPPPKPKLNDAYVPPPKPKAWSGQAQ